MEPQGAVRQGQRVDEVKMDTHRKNAYRFLLYWAMLDIRPLAWHGYVRGWRKLNPLNWRRQIRAMRIAGVASLVTT